MHTHSLSQVYHRSDQASEVRSYPESSDKATGTESRCPFQSLGHRPRLSRAQNDTMNRILARIQGVSFKMLVPFIHQYVYILYIYICIYNYMYVYIYICVYHCISLYVYIYICISLYILTYVYLYTIVYDYIYIIVYLYICIYTQLCVYIYIYVYMYIII